MSDEDWVKAAMTDDSVVVELLVRLHQAKPPPPSTDVASHPPPALPLEWTVRQRRSKPIPHHHHQDAKDKKTKKPTPRASPTTPLSWSGGATSVSGGGAAAAGDGCEESSRPRSKVTASSETTTNKRTRKKKTLAELKEEETLLVKERRHLKRELATLRVTLETQRATNESLKRLKYGILLQVDLESQPVAERVTAVELVGSIPDQAQQKLASCDPINHEYAERQPPTPNVSSQLQQNQDDKFVLPDLNVPLADSSNSEVLYSVS